ncbi:hypothetical protein EGH10_13470 [Brevibacillus laterosporus]|uniref:hypothetical protein n=1 Tax=Brevibacillus laterosporus TaxID=1465 RepID=UPI0002150CE0|nr:hypothetical protein [Brevibacillus laterosporus]RJL11481.1 hypothetical protein DM460_10030 [Brevibacillus laterosporus]TPH09299.1 hypothetical protein EGH10_13470 [Brevibacillus laterosporus]
MGEEQVNCLQWFEFQSELDVVERLKSVEEIRRLAKALLYCCIPFERTYKRVTGLVESDLSLSLTKEVRDEVARRPVGKEPIYIRSPQATAS